MLLSARPYNAHTKHTFIRFVEDKQNQLFPCQLWIFISTLRNSTKKNEKNLSLFHLLYLFTFILAPLNETLLFSRVSLAFCTGAKMSSVIFELCFIQSSLTANSHWSCFPYSTRQCNVKEKMRIEKRKEKKCVAQRGKKIEDPP